MNARPAKSLNRRVRKLEVCFEARLVTIERSLDPFSGEAIVLRLAAGEWECAIKLLDGQQCGLAESTRSNRRICSTSISKTSRACDGDWRMALAICRGTSERV